MFTRATAALRGWVALWIHARPTCVVVHFRTRPGDMEAARALHEALGRLPRECVGADPEVVDLAARRGACGRAGTRYQRETIHVGAGSSSTYSSK